MKAAATRERERFLSRFRLAFTVRNGGGWRKAQPVVQIQYVARLISMAQLFGRGKGRNMADLFSFPVSPISPPRIEIPGK